jgi:hypothetical protein
MLIVRKERNDEQYNHIWDFSFLASRNRSLSSSSRTSNIWKWLSVAGSKSISCDLKTKFESYFVQYQSIETYLCFFWC